MLIADNSELMTDLLPEAFITCTSANPEYYVTIKTQTLKEAHRWHDAVLALSRRTPAAEAGDVSEAEVEAVWTAIVAGAARNYNARAALRPALEQLLAARRVHPKQAVPSPDVAGLIEHVQMFVLPDGNSAVCVGGRFGGWLMWRHPDGQWVSQQKLDEVDPNEGLPSLFKAALSRLTPPKQDDARDSTVGADVSVEVLSPQVRSFLDKATAEITQLRASLASARADALKDAAKVVERDAMECAHMAAAGYYDSAESAVLNAGRGFAAAIRALINKDAGGHDDAQ